MKATGIVRRIDDLGRVVIPKEIRRTLRIREGDPLEIFTDRDGEVILKKYSPMVDLSLFAQEYADSLNEATGCIAVIADEHEVVGVSGAPRKLFFEKRISEDAEGIMESGKTFMTSTPGEKPVIDGAQFASQVVAPILADGEPEGVVVLMSKEPREMGPTEIKLVETAAEFLGKQLLH
ncbi:MAG: stage V sporulation T C-terminal domain-containing protein [Bacillota bacterium]|nr:stage V sporulation T C-terminal domain-containing protein [Bacillota bacterium]NLH86811.1 AbrB/MazE/SpoVT family DNA-binding domain-containing protein [Bacillota bacterium]